MFWILQQKEAPREEIEANALHAIDILEGHITSGEDTAQRYYRLAVLYDELIFDAPSWMKYNSTKEKYLNLCVAIDPEYKDARILQIENLLFEPSNAGGDETTGLTKLETLGKEYPEDPDILIIYADYYLEKEVNDLAKEYYSRVLEQTPNHFQALIKYNELILIEKSLPIGTIFLKNKVKTRLGHKLDLVKELEGRIYNRKSKNTIREIFYSLPSVTGIQIVSIENEKGTVDLSLKISENNMKAYGILAGMGVYNVYDNTTKTDYYPGLLYMDQNLLGTGNNLTVMFAGVYLGIDFTIPERSGLPFSLSFHTDGFFLPVDYNYIVDGAYTEWDLKTPEYNASVKLKKETPFGLTFYTLHNLQINNYEGSASWFIKPENNITYTGAVQFGFSTIETGDFPSNFTPSTGFEISIKPTLVFKPDYQSWGPDTNLFTHNDLPGGMFKTSVKFSKAPTKTTYFGCSLGYYDSDNIYESEKWAIGQTNIMSSGPRLSGYLSEEYRSENAVMANLDAHYQILQDKILIFGKHDIYYDIDKNLFRQGSCPKTPI